MTTLILHHPAALEHRVPDGHPERPERIRAVEAALGRGDLAALPRRQPAAATIETVTLAHPPAWVETLLSASPADGTFAIDGDTLMSPGTLEAALRGVGAATEAVDAVVTGEASNAFSAMRPPGHHAERTRAMGFCFFNNAAIAARHAQKRHGAGRVAIVDWDVHHGNGTQDILWDDPTILYCSTHQMPLFPGTGARRERGDHDTIVNAPLRPGDGSETFRDAFTSAVLPRLEAFAPDLVIVSAGFDAHRRDPLADIRLETEDFAWATREVLALARRHCGGRLVSLLEGGYDLQALGDSVAAHVGVLAEEG